jgi:WD40 repeat protein
MSRNCVMFIVCLVIVSACAPVTRTPAAQPVSTLTVVVLTEPPPRPSVTPPPIAVTPVVDLADMKVQYRDRQEWRIRLGWPNECEETFQRTSLQEPDGFGGVIFYKTTTEKLLASVTCTVGPYWVEERLYLIDPQADPLTATPLMIPELTRQGGQDWVQHEVDQIHGLPSFDQDTQTLINLAPSRGLKDCGFFYVYRLDNERLVLEEARYHDCDDANPVLSDQWEIIYPHPATVSPTSTPAATASNSDGPYLVYRKNTNQHEAVVVMNSDGTDQKTLPLPTGAIVDDLAQAVSPDGKWLAFHTGSAGERTADQFDLALNVLDMTTGQTQLITALLSADYPANFNQAADEFTQQGVVIVEGADSFTAASFLQEAFLAGIHVLAWSPDGRYLAFAGQMDGPSSDLYDYDVAAQTITRLSDGPEQIQSIAWSPDGKWILHGSALMRGEGVPINYHAATADGSAMKTLSSSIIGLHGWSGPAAYLQSQGSNGSSGLFDLRSVDIGTGESRAVWDGTFRSVAVDPENQQLAISGFESIGGSGASALYLIDLKDGRRRKIDDKVARVQFLGVGDLRFRYDTIEGDSRHTRFLLSDGSTRPAAINADRLSVSPDHRYLLTIGKNFQVYTADEVLVRTSELPQVNQPIGDVIWRPDSSGFFFTSGSDLYTVDLLAGEADRVDGGLLIDRPLDYAWIEGQ